MKTIIMPALKKTEVSNVESLISLEDILLNKCPKCSAAPTGKCLEKKQGGIGGFQWVEIPHQERIQLAILKQKKKVA